MAATNLLSFIGVFLASAAHFVLTRWLHLFEGDLIVMLMAVGNKEKFDLDMYRTLQVGYAPKVPKPEQVSSVKNKKPK